MTDRPGLDPARTALLVMGYSRGPHRHPHRNDLSPATRS
jgi:hypothetical protein